MSADIYLKIEKTEEGIRVYECGVSCDFKSHLGTYKTAEEALGVLEDIMEVEGNYFEGLVISGFASEKRKR
jgi:hypothetical protein